MTRSLVWKAAPATTTAPGAMVNVIESEPGHVAQQESLETSVV